MPEANELNDLLADLTSPNSGLRRAAATDLANHPQRQRATVALIEALGDHLDYVVTAASDALVGIGGQDAHAALLRLLRHPNAFVREHVLWIFRPIWRESDFDVILETHQHDSSTDVRKRAGFLLRDVASKKTWHRLFDLWHNDSLPRYRVWGCELAQQFGDATIRDRLATLVSDDDGHVRKAADKALGRLQSYT